jgi:MYXO-CTERM domain-containing protein
MSMKVSKTIGAAIIMACGSTAFAGAVVDLAPSQFVGGLSGIMNTQMSELIGASQSDIYQDFSIYAGGARGESPLYEGTLMTRVVRSNETGNLTFNYRILDPNAQLAGVVSNIEVSGFEGFQTRIEFRNELTSPGSEGPESAIRDLSGDILDFSFDGGLATADESRFFFAMTDTDTFYENAATATIYLQSGESVSLSVVGANPAVPAPGALGLLSAAGLISVRRRR